MRTKLSHILTAFLLCFAGIVAFGQNALDRNQSTYQVGSYTPSGNTGAYYEDLHFKYEITPVSVSSDNQSEYDKIQIVFRAFPGEVNTYKYNSKNYNVADLCNYNSRSLNHLSKFTMSISVSGGGTNEFIIENLGAVVIQLNKSYKREELKQVNVTNIKLVKIYPDDIAVAAVERCLSQQQQEKDEKAKKELDAKIAEGKKERETSNDRTQNTKNSYRYNNVSATQQKIATIDKAHSEFNNAIDQAFEPTRQKAREHQQKSADYWDNMVAEDAARRQKKLENEKEYEKKEKERREKEREAYYKREQERKQMAEIALKNIEAGKYDDIGEFSDDGLAVVNVGGWYGKFGFINKSGQEVIPLQYDGVLSDFYKGVAIVRLNGKCAIIDKTGKDILSFKYNFIGSLVDGVRVVNIGATWANKGFSGTGKYGFIDETGKEIIPLKYDRAESFSEGLAMVFIGDIRKGRGKYGFINKTGQVVIPLEYENASSFSEGLAYVGNDEGKYGFIDKTGKVVIPFKYSYIDENTFSEGMAVVRLYSYSVRTDKHTEKYGFVDKTGQEVIPLEYDFAEPFKDGKAKVKLDGKEFYIHKKEIAEKQQEKIRSQLAQGITPDRYDEMGKFSKEGLAYVSRNGKFGFIDKNGKEIIPLKYDLVSTFSEYLDGLSVVKLNEKIGSIDPTGKEVIPLKYESARFFDGMALVTLNNKMDLIDKSGKEITSFKYDGIGEFSDGLAPVALNDKIGFIDKTGKEVIPLKYDQIGHEGFSEGLSRVALSNKWGYIDKSGKEVIPVKYEFARSFSEGVASVKMDGKWGFIDNTGKVIIEIRYDMTNSFSEGLAHVNMGGIWEFDESSYDFQPAQEQLGKYGFVNKSGTEIIPLKYDFAWSFNDGLAMVVSNQKWGFIDKSGKEVIPLKYDRVEPFQGGLVMVMFDNKVGFVDKTGKEVIPLIYDGAEPFYNGNGKTRVKLNDRVFYIDKTGKEVKE